jgi:hypothetical protein
MRNGVNYGEIEYQTLGQGESFRDCGDYLMKILDTFPNNAVRLTDGCLMDYAPDTLVEPIKLKFVLDD